MSTEEAFLWVCALPQFVLWLGSCILCIFMQASMRHGKIFTPLDINATTQITRDWTTSPFVDIKPVKLSADQQGCPNEYPEEFLQETWHGTRYFCDCFQDKRGKKAFARQVDSICSDDHYQGGCLSSEAHAAVSMSRIRGYKICGKRGAIGFINAQRPKQLAKAGARLVCEEGWLPCDPNGNAEYTYCYPYKGSVEDDCPITSFSLKDGDVSKPVFGKKGDALPILSTAIQADRPCINPFETPEVKGHQIYYGEMRRNSFGCTSGSDMRSQESGLKISEYDLLVENGVLNILEDYRSFTHTVFPGSSVLKNYELKSWSRSTIPWSLQCESDGDTRQQLFRLLDFNGTYSNKGLGLTDAAVIVMFTGGTIVVRLQHYCPIAWQVFGVVGASLLIGPLVGYHEYVREINEDLALIDDERLANVKTCSDKEYAIDHDEAKATLLSNLQAASTIYWFLLAFIVLQFASLVIIFLGLVFIKFVSMDIMIRNMVELPSDFGQYLKLYMILN